MDNLQPREYNRRMSRMFVVVGILAILVPVGAKEPADAQGTFTFVVTADNRNYTGPGVYDTSQYFRGAMEAIALQGGGDWMISPGDIDPPANSYWTITSTLGTDYLWYPAVGNHELPGAGSEAFYGANMDWLRSYDYDPNGSGTPPDIVNIGPSGCPTTTYSFDYENAHFVMLNEYCDIGGDTATDGDIPDHLYEWLAADLAATAKPIIFVFGHEPAYPQPDADNGRLRHLGDSLDKYTAHRDRFWNLLKDERVLVYVCGHTHNYSIIQIDDMWQLDVGHARGAGDTGAPSTFVMIHVDGSIVTYDTYRDTHDGVYDYADITHTGTLSPPTSVDLVSFAALAQDQAVLLTWDTANELNILGFDLYRAEQVDGPLQLLTESPIPSQGSGDPAGNHYDYLDKGVAPARRYYYWLDVVDVYGGITRHGPVVVLASPSRVYLPLLLK
jgi:predicted phosphodiesterase